jgi:DNA mismatch repair protein MutS2
LEIQKNKAVIGMGDLRSTVALSKLEKLEPEQNQSTKKQAPKGIDLNTKMQHFSSELNVIGTRGEEALKQLDDYLDDALMLGMKQVRIVHGKGYGILRKLIRNSLKLNKMVETFQDEHIELGGDGVTIVTLKV